MPRTPRELVKAAADLRASFSERFRALDARRKQIVEETIRAAEQKRIREIRQRYD